MKIKLRQKIAGLLLVLFVLTGIAQAQTNDSVVNFEADVAGLSLASLDSLPTGGTFWVVTPPGDGVNGVMPPYPCLPANVSYGNIYTLPNGAFLVDASGNDGDRQQVLSQINAVSNIIELSSVPVASQPMGMRAQALSGPPSFDDTNDDDSGTNYLPMALNFTSINTNLLWLEITNVSNQIAYLNLHNGTNKVYGIYATPDLTIPFTNWIPTQEVWPTNATTNTLPFIAIANNQTNTFYRALDWTGYTVNGLPAWWTFEWFGNLNESASGLDGQNNTFGYDYTNKINPAALGFSAIVTNSYVNTAYPNIPVVVFSGVPTAYAILVNNTNRAGAIWQPYVSSNLIANLGADGNYDVAIGLRGYAGSQTAAWQDILLVKDTVPPIVTLTSPAKSTVVQPMIQVQGFANEALGQITFDVSNATGLFTNQTAYTTGQYFDTNLLVYTTNNFQCYDVAMAAGLNMITVHAFDLAGNETTQATNYTLDYAGYTNAPQLKLVWPLPNMLIVGSNFTLQATVDDDTAQITASMVSTNGITNVVAALVERNGNVWADNLPLTAGTNIVTLIATNAAGNVSTTNFTVIQSSVSLTVNPIAANDLNQSLATVTGTVTPGENVWVNGLLANVAGGSWSATNVPVSPYGQANLTVRAGANTNSIDGSQTLNQLQPVVMAVSSYSADYHYQTYNPNFELDKDYANDYQQYNFGWTYVGGGNVTDDQYVQGTDEYDYSSSSSTSVPPGSAGLSGNQGFLPYVYAAFSQPINDIFDVGSEQLSMQTHTAIQPQGTATAGQTSWYLVETCALEYSNTVNNLNNALYHYNAGNVPLPPEWLEIQGQPLVNTGITNTSGAVWGAALVSAPAGVPPDATPTITQFHQNPMASFTNQAQPVHLAIVDNNSGVDLTLQTNTVIVGQQMNFTAKLSITNSFMTNLMLNNFQWQVPGFALTNFYVSSDSFSTNGYPIPLTATNQQMVNFFWADGETNWSSASNRIVQCSATINGKIITNQAVFKVLKPIARIISKTGDVSLGYAIPDGQYYGVCFGTTNEDVPGIQFSNALTMPSAQYNYNYGNTNSSIDWVQLLPSAFYIGYENGTNLSLSGSGNILDSTFPYGFSDYPNADDSPSVTLSASGETAASFTLHAQMWVLFRPFRGNRVPLRVVNWNCSGSATNNGSGWMLTNSYWTTNPPDMDAGNTYPSWTNNFSNTNVFFWK